MLKTEAVKQLLSIAGNEHLTKLYTPEMEVQVNVTQGNGVRVLGDWKGKRWVGWKDDVTGEIWKSFRIPWNAKKTPEYIDSELKFSLPAHVEGVGMTGWNWVKRQSMWVGFDFDSIANHKEGLTDDELQKIRDIVFTLPWVTLVRSTSGKGFHIYIHFEQPVSTPNHTIHAALARSILTVLSVEAGYNFSGAVDAMGGVLWVQHTKQEGTNGLALLKEGSKFPNEKIPKNWQEHADVTSGRTHHIRGNLSDPDAFKELISSVKKGLLDDGHKTLLDWFNKPTSIPSGPDKDWWWDSDNNMLVCHTFDLKKAYKALKLRGIFDTTSSGSSTQNCYAFPIESGAWVVRRHSPGVKEHPSWVVDPSGWTRCVLNATPEFTVSARSSQGIENAKGAYVFQSVENGLLALRNIDITIDLPTHVMHRQMMITEKADGKLIISFMRETSDPAIEGFLSNKKGDEWEKVIHRKKQKREVHAPDFLIRHIISQGTEAGWWIRTRGEWVMQNKSNVITVLLGQEDCHNRGDSELLMSKAILNPWKLINEPFMDEYPGNRCWNKDAAALAVKPITGSCDTWMKVLNHCGKGLDNAVQTDAWCIKNAINTGSEYLLCWIASMFQSPTEPLPYLFFYGPQNSGKSTLHEALSGLFKNNKGYARADNALINQQGFNAEIGNSVLCVVEETDLKGNKDAGNRIKDWVTGKTISINTKYKTVYDMRNSTHWMQCANDISFCPVIAGDTRIVVIYVDVPEKEIPKYVLFEQLEEEKAAFLNLVMDVELPKPEGRLAMPCLMTMDKEEISEYNKNDLERFISEKVKIVMGHQIEFYDFFSEFQKWLPSAEQRKIWTPMRVSRYYPKQRPFVKGKTGQNSVTVLGNVSFDLTEKDTNQEMFIDANGRIERKFFHGNIQ